jgi:hypothetical protein
MKKQSRLCFNNPAVISLLFLILCGNSAMAAPIDDARAAAANSGGQALGLYGTKTGSNANISVPMTNSNTSMNTVDHSKSFTANLTSPSSSKFLEMLIQPAPSGDLQQVIIAQDLNTDSVYDNTYAVPRLVSGVCANGYISCNQGTWANCFSYQWVSDSIGKISDVAVPIMNLGGCYCINNSCGSNLVWTNSSIVLKDLAGGVLAAIQNSNINFTITNVSYTPVTIDYYGNVTGNPPTAVSTLNNVVLTPPVSTLQSYFANVNAFSNDINGNVQAQTLLPSSLYSQVLTVNNSGNKASCNITRNAGIATQQNYCFEAPFPNELNEVQQHSYVKMDSGLTRSGNNSCLCYFTLIQDGIGCFPYSAPTVTALPAGAVDTGEEAADGWFNAVGCDYGPCPCSYHIYKYYDICVRIAGTVSETIDDQCASLETSSNCSLDSEVIDGIQTLANGTAIGITPLPTCKDYNTPGGIIHLCRPWWAKTRTYLCHNSQAWNFDDVKTRYNTVANSVTQNGDYSDQTKGTSGTWTTSAGSATLPIPPPVAPCELSCKTQSTVGSTQVLVTGLISLRANPSTAGNFSYKLCVNNACPLDAGEVVIDDCKCLSGFDQAVMALQSVRLAGKDMICTSGVKKVLP